MGEGEWFRIRNAFGSIEFGKAPTVSFGNVIDQLHDEHRLPNTSTTKKTNLTTFLIGREEIDNLYGNDHAGVFAEFVSRQVSTEGFFDLNEYLS